jgi:hypothetical protein
MVLCVLFFCIAFNNMGRYYVIVYFIRVLLEAGMNRSMRKIRKLLVIGFLVISIVVFFASAYAAPKKGKPQSPVQVSIAPSNPSVSPESIKPGDVVEFLVTAVSLAAADEMQIFVTLPTGAVLVSGDLSWSGTAREGEKRSLNFTIKVPTKQSGPIKARVVIPSVEGHSFSASAHYSLRVPAKSKDKDGSISPVKKDSKGSDVIEYR